MEWDAGVTEIGWSAERLFHCSHALMQSANIGTFRKSYVISTCIYQTATGGFTVHLIHGKIG